MPPPIQAACPAGVAKSEPLEQQTKRRAPASAELLAASGAHQRENFLFERLFPAEGASHIPNLLY